MAHEIRWAHACNSIAQLDEALASDLHAIEADVSWNDPNSVAVMKHAFSSQEPIEKECIASDWVKRALSVSKDKTRIVKFDFKNLKAVPSVVDAIEKYWNEGAPDIWLNADILHGPGADKSKQPPVDASLFVEYCSRIPHATLSLGWTTKYSIIRSLQYEHEQIDEMLTIVKAFPDRKVTFPIRASLAANSWKALTQLLKHSPHASITLWTAHEGVPQRDLDWIISQCEPHQVYIDCDKGPKYPHWDPRRLLEYDWRAILN